MSQPDPTLSGIAHQAPSPEWAQWSMTNAHRAGGVVVLPNIHISPAAVAYPGETVRVFAGRLDRFGARALDQIFAYVVAFTLNFVATPIAYGGEPLFAFTIYFGLAIPYVLFFEPLMTTLYGGSLGKLIVGLQVVRTSNPIQRPNFGIIMWRWIFYLAPGFPMVAVQFATQSIGVGASLVISLSMLVLTLLDVLWLTWDKPRRQCLHDKVAGTIVVLKPPAPTFPYQRPPLGYS